MQLAIGTYTYGWRYSPESLELFEGLPEYWLLEQATRHGIKVVEISDNLPLHQFDPGRLAAFRRALADCGIRLQVGARGLTHEHLEQYVELADIMDARILRMVVDDGAYEPSLKDSAQILKKSLGLLEAHDVTVALENHDRWSAKELAYLVRRIDSPFVRICLDTANSLAQGEKLEQVLKVLAPYTVNAHAKDVGIGRLAHQQGFKIEGRIAGTGLTDIPHLRKVLLGFGLCHTVVLEQWVPPEDTLLKTIDKESLWAEKSITYLQSIFH